jgi:hypothetical protein
MAPVPFSEAVATEWPCNMLQTNSAFVGEFLDQLCNKRFKIRVPLAEAVATEWPGYKLHTHSAFVGEFLEQLCNMSFKIPIWRMCQLLRQ